MIIGLVRGLPDRAERQAAQGADLPMASTDGPPPPETKDLPDGAA
jgi:hypothetical protein